LQETIHSGLNKYTT